MPTGQGLHTNLKLTTAAGFAGSVIPYGSDGMLARWKKDYWDRRYFGLISWLVVAILIGFVVAGPNWLLFLCSFLPLDQLGNSGASIRAHQTILVVASLFFAAAIASVTLFVARPCALELSKMGLRKRWIIGAEPLFPWSSLSRVNLYLPPQSVDARCFELHFVNSDGSCKLKLALGALPSDEQKEALLVAIEAGAPLAIIDERACELLTPKRSMSAAELWLESLSAAPGAERLLPLSEGAVVNHRYAVKRVLSADGQGAYLAEDLHTKSDVILKEKILPVYASASSRKRAVAVFQHRASALESIAHPGIVKVLDSFVLDYRAFIVFDHLRGQTLRELIERSGPLPAYESVKLALQFCDIIEQFHAASLVFGAFGPDKIIVSEDRSVILADLTTSAGDNEGGADPFEESVYVAPVFMAPEQLQGRPGAQSDIYSLACTVYYMLTAQKPEPLGECWAVLANSDLTRSLNDVIATASRYELEKRYKTVSELREALLAVLPPPH